MAALQQASIVDERFAEHSRAMIEPDPHHIAEHLIHDRDPDLGRPLDDDEAIETLTSFVYAAIGGQQPPRPRLA